MKLETPGDVRKLRRSLNWTQAEAAKMCHVSLNTWQRMETGIRPMNQTVVELFAYKARDAMHANGESA